MIVRNLEEIEGTERDVDFGNGKSRRLLLEADGMGYSLTDTLVHAGTESRMQYKNHLEACYCISGAGELEDAAGNKYPVRPGTMYALDKNDPHILRAFEDVRVVCVFLPALRGGEKHDFSGDGHSAY
jgi:L-ectoine synthase